MMDIKVASELPLKVRNSCLLIGISSKGALSPSAAVVDKDAGGYLKKLIKRGDLTGVKGQSRLLMDLPGSSFERVVVVGTGDEKALSTAAYLKLLRSAFKSARKTPAATIVSTLAEVAVEINSAAATAIGDDKESIEHWKVFQQALAAEETGYKFTGHDGLGKSTVKAAGKKKNAGSPGSVIITLTDATTRTAGKQAKAGQSVGKGLHLAKDLGNLAANICTPSYLAEEARSLARKTDKLKVSVLGEKQMEKLGMGAFLAVSNGSREEAKLILMEYKGGPKNQRPTVLVGKGITFDTGGISIKPSAAMDEMKFDMCGAASVFGAVAASIDMGLKRNVVFAIAAAENMPDGAAARPGDVVSTMSGQTVEILNTDAEGRLVLCDTLTYIQRYKPAAVIDVATLTGACIVALGGIATGLMSNSQSLADELLVAGQDSGDRAWQLPLWDEYAPMLDSNFADLGNIGGRYAGAITAGMFLKAFAEEFDWAHLDIAGTAWNSGGAKGATGRPVGMLMQYLMNASDGIANKSPSGTTKSSKKK